MDQPDPRNASGLILSVTEPLRSFLASACDDRRLSEELRDIASDLRSRNTVPYKLLRAIWTGSDPSTRPALLGLFSGSGFVFTSPKPREKSEELKLRLLKLREIAERKEYAELVKDITPRKQVEEPFSSYKDQLGFGLHVGLTMFTGYLVGYASFRALFNRNPALSAAGGILGLVLAMLVETLLFIIKTSKDDQIQSSKSSSSSSFTPTIKKNQ
ncbi:BnaA10g06370D [Brassica napus]|uniref:BnaA10g06370D protein n=2 Tax=Brassica napus TaxID=3708 RepID=A0A078IKG0_BRANA|nr:BnaA10g06370D [Brassica napus]